MTDKVNKASLMLCNIHALTHRCKASRSIVLDCIAAGVAN
jgi:hypothetical protein